jgi:hypothetical protein
MAIIAGMSAMTSPGAYAYVFTTTDTGTTGGNPAQEVFTESISATAPMEAQARAHLRASMSIGTLRPAAIRLSMRTQRLPS